MKVNFVWLSLFLLFVSSVHGQISITSLPYNPAVETFNSYNPISASSTNIPAGWTLSSSGTSTYNGKGTGTSNTGGYWAYGTTSPDEYSLGALRSGTPGNITYSVSFTNNSGVTISSLTLSWDYEQWRYANTSGWNCSGTGALSGNSTIDSKDFTGSSSGTNGTVTVTGVSSFTLTGLSIANGQTFGISWITTDVSGSDNGIAIDNFSISASGTVLSPTITITPTSLSFGSVLINTNSVEQSYTVSGTNLTDNLIISTGTSIFTVSTNSGGTFSQTINLTPSGGTVSQTIYMRFNPQSATDYSRTISHTSTGATTQNLTATGKGIKAEPTNHVTNFSINTVTSSSINLTWTDATGTVLPERYLIKGSSVSFGNIASPADGTPESDGTLVKNISQGTQAVTFSGLSQNTTYYFKIFPYTNSDADINYKTDETIPEANGTTTGVSTAYFRSKQNGNWNQVTSWESSTDNTNWSDAASTPTSSSNIITIKTGHTINITESVTIDQAVVESGATLNYTGGTLTIANGDGDDLIIYGTFKHNQSKEAPYASGSTLRVKTGGTLEVNNNGTSASHYGTSSQIIYENGAVFYWNVSAGAQFQTSNVTYFPNSTENEIPVFRVNTPDIYVGAGTDNPTTINGVFQVDANTVYWQYDGTKTFRNGIRGSGNVTQRSAANTCGQFIISGTNAELGGTGTLTLNTNGLTISITANASLISNKTVNGGTLNVNGTLNTANYTLSGTTNFALNSNASLSIGSANGISSSGATGNIQNSGTRTFNTNANYIYNGIAAQNSGSGLPLSVNNLTIDNSAGVTLSQNVSVTNSLTLTNGVLNTQSNNISFTSTAASPTETSTNYILGNAIMQSRDLGTGGITDFLGLSISSGSGNVTGLSFTRNTGTAKTYGTNQSITCSWEINGSISASAERLLTLKWFDTFDNGKVFSEGNHGQLWKSTDNGTTWTPQGNTVNVSSMYPRAISTDVTSFSSWTASDANTPLPVKLATFNSSVKVRDIKLNWVTAEELNNSGFEIERKTGNSDWIKAGFVNGKNMPSSYEFTDKNLTTGKYQYRLKQIDFNGNFEYHNLDGIVEIGVPAKFDLSQNFPNPFNPVTNISYQVASAGLVKITVYDMLGKEIKTLVNEFKEPGYYNLNFDAGNLNSGIYFYKMNAGNFSSVKKLVLIK